MAVKRGRKKKVSLARDDALPLYYQVYLVLRQQLTEGRFTEDQPIPGEEQLRERFGVSRVTIRKTFANNVRRKCKDCTCAELHAMGYSWIKEACCINKNHAAMKCCGLCKELGVQCFRSYAGPSRRRYPAAGTGRASIAGRAGSAGSSESAASRSRSNEEYYYYPDVDGSAEENAYMHYDENDDKK